MHNIAINAVQAMPGGGTVLICARKHALDEHNARSLPPGRYVQIEIRDNGPGIPPDHIDRIFDPIFPHEHRAAVWGWPLCIRSCANMTVRLRLSRNPEKGRLFSAAPAAAGTPEALRPSAAALRTDFGLRVLVMDDEQMVRDVAAGYLTHLGCG